MIGAERDETLFRQEAKKFASWQEIILEGRSSLDLSSRIRGYCDSRWGSYLMLTTKLNINDPDNETVYYLILATLRNSTHGLAFNPHSMLIDKGVETNTVLVVGTDQESKFYFDKLGNSGITRTPLRSNIGVVNPSDCVIRTPKLNRLIPSDFELAGASLVTLLKEIGLKP